MSDTEAGRGILAEADGGGERTSSVPHPENDSDSTKSKRRRPSHIRKSRKDSTTKVLRVRRHPDDPIDDGDEGARKELWKRVANDPPPLPDPPLHRRIPPPAPLPAEPPIDEPLPAAWSDDKPKLRRVEEAVGIVGLAVLVAAMLVAMWLRMTGG